jgi:hypothetical protein
VQVITFQFIEPIQGWGGGIYFTELIQLKKLVVIALSILFMVLPGCITYKIAPPTSIPTPTPTPITQTDNPTIVPPSVVNFVATPETITAGQNTNLIWVVTGAESVIIEPGLGKMAPSGTYIISPTNTTIYTLIATGHSDNISKSVTVIVNPIVKIEEPIVKPPEPISDNKSDSCPIPVDVSFTVFPDQVALGEQRSLLRWSVKGVDRVHIVPDIGDVAAEGNYGIMPKITTTYVLTAETESCVINKSVTINVTGTFVPPDSGPVVELFNVTPSIYSGESGTLQWRVKGATTVTIDHGIGIVASTGSMTVSPKENTTYAMTVANGAAFYSVTVRIVVLNR